MSYMKMEPVEKILIIRTDRLGDVILTLPLAQAVKEKFSDVFVGFLARNYTAPVIEMSPFVDEILSIEDEALLSKLRNYDAAILVHPTPRDAFLLWRAKIPMRIGTAYRAYSFLFTHRIREHRKDCRHHELTYNLHLLRPLGIDSEWLSPKITIPRNAIENAHAIVQSNSLSEEKFIAVHPGSMGSSLKWSVTRFAELAKILFEKNIPFIVTAGQNEKMSAMYVAGKNGIVISDIDIKTLAALYSMALAIVASNTGTLHLADAVGTKVFSVYPVLKTMSSARWAPANFPDGIITPDMKPCTACSKRCPHYPCPDKVTAEQVFDKINSIFGYKI